MNAIVPLNIAAVRVNANDNSNLVNNFKGCTAVFDQMPYRSGSNSGVPSASTGDHVYIPLEGPSTAHNPLGAGVHVHWELPDYFRRGVQSANGADPVFPAAPNRWLVIRYLSVYNAGQYGPVQAKTWLVESDYLASQQSANLDGVTPPLVSVPVPANPALGVQPYMYLGQTLDYAKWNPAGESASNYLPSQTGEDGKPLYLTSIGFVGPSFASYYPECCSVFGFWDYFKDNTAIYQAITQDQPIQFKVSYQVIGWLNDPTIDPLVNLQQQITTQYNNLLAQWKSQGVTPTQTPADVFGTYMEQNFRWAFHQQDIVFTLDNNHNLTSLTVPEQTLCAGTMQEIVWQLLPNQTNISFLANTDANAQNPYLWTDNVEVAVGNTTVEALSALLKKDLKNTDNDPDLLGNFEYLLDAFQLGLLNGLENNANPIFNLDEQLHARAFARFPGGQLWTVQQQPPANTNLPPDPDREVTLPLDLAEQLHLLNTAQKKYDQHRAQVLAMREQLFMDWFHYIKLYVGEITDSNIPLNKLTEFLFLPGSTQCELSDVIQAGNTTGVLSYQQNSNGQIIGLGQPPSSTTSLAYAVWQNFQTLLRALKPYPSWSIQCVPAPAFWMPSDPVLLVEGDRIEPVRRNGPTDTIAVRLSGELLSEIKLAFNSTDWTVAAANLAVAGLPTWNSQQPMTADVQALVGEACLLTPMLASVVATALQSQGGNNNPAVGTGYANFITALQNAQGGLSPVDQATSDGLFAAIRKTGYVAAANPVQGTTTPLAITFTFSNAANNGWAPDPVGWNSQLVYLEFGKTRFDPFLPTFLIWHAELAPLVTNNAQNYDANNLTDYFQLDADAIDYQYKTGVNFTATNLASMQNSVVLSKKPTFSLSSQIANYLQNYPNDPAKTALENISTAYNNRSIMSQAMSGFNLAQTLRQYVPQVALNNLVSRPGMDTVTPPIHTAALTANDDNWYDFHFNGMMPVATGIQGLYNFGLLRSGFAGIQYLEIVDVFGQRMQLNTLNTNPDKTLQVISAFPLQPEQGDLANANKIFFPPRWLAPTRLWFRWLSAAFNTDISGVSGDFVEMNTHPATSPVCGWIIPNHLDVSLLFYDADGAAIGSFGIEHGAQKYRTQPANIAANPGDNLAADLKNINPNLANFMQYVDGQGGTDGFLVDLMLTIANASTFINPANFPQNAGLSVFIGRPLAITRAVVALETAGNVLPLSQADVNTTDAFPADVAADRFDYLSRQQYSSGDVSKVQFPLRLGDLTQTDDGMVGYLIETDSGYQNKTLYSPAAPTAGGNNVVQPPFNNLLLSLNATPVTVTMLVDPRAAVNATVGSLPVNSLQIPPDQYAQTMQSLAMTFFTHPLLAKQQGLTTPLPQETAYLWSWIQPSGNTINTIPQKANAVDDTVTYGYSPQTLLEGWLQLQEAETKNS